MDATRLVENGFGAYKIVREQCQGKKRLVQLQRNNDHISMSAGDRARADYRLINFGCREGGMRA